MSETQTAEKQGETGGQGSALRQAILKSRLTVQAVQSWNPAVSEKFGYSQDAKNLLSGFDTLKGLFLEVDKKLQSASKSIQDTVSAQVEMAKTHFESLYKAEVGISAEERKEAQRKLDNRIKDVNQILTRIETLTKKEISDKQAAEERQRQEQEAERQRQEQIKADQTFIKTIGTSFGDLQVTYGDKLESQLTSRIGTLLTAFDDVKQGTRSLTDKERTSATNLRDTETKTLRELLGSHAAIEKRMAEGLQVPEGASEDEKKLIGGQRDAISTLLGKRPVVQSAVKDASGKIDTLTKAIDTCVTDVAERKRLAEERTKRGREITAALTADAYMVPADTDAAESKTLGGYLTAITNALGGDAPTVEGLQKAEQALKTLGTAVAQAKLDIAERKRLADERATRGREIIKLLDGPAYTVPPGAGEKEAQALTKDRQTITDALAASPPSVDDLALAEKTLLALGTAVAKVGGDISEAKAAVQRPKQLNDRLSQLDMRTFGPLLSKDAAFRPSRAFVDGLLRSKPQTLTEQEFNDASGHLATMERRVAETTGDFEGRQQGFQTWLASFNYLDVAISDVNRANPDGAKTFNARYRTLRLEVEAALKLGITEFTGDVADDVDQKLDDLNTLAIEVNDTLNPPTGPVTAFDWQKPTTWDVQPIRFAGAGTQGYVEGLSGADPGMVDRIANAGVGDRHSAAKICTGKPMHQHTDSGSGGISFAYGHLGGVKVEPVIYDFASKRDGNDYRWQHGGLSNGPSGLPGSVKAKV